MPTLKCKNCGKEYEQKIKYRSDPDICPHCGFDNNPKRPADWKLS